MKKVRFIFVRFSRPVEYTVENNNVVLNHIEWSACPEKPQTEFHDSEKQTVQNAIEKVWGKDHSYWDGNIVTQHTIAGNNLINVVASLDLIVVE